MLDNYECDNQLSLFDFEIAKRRINETGTNT